MAGEQTEILESAAVVDDLHTGQQILSCRFSYKVQLHQERQLLENTFSNNNLNELLEGMYTKQ